MATESYGARMSVTFINYFNSQNALIRNGSLNGLELNVTALAVNK
jgi:hypothetical protein